MFEQNKQMLNLFKQNKQMFKFMKKIELLKDIKQTLEPLPPETQLKVLKAAISYLGKEDIEELEAIDNAIFSVWKNRVDEILDRDKKTSESRAAAGRKSWEVRAKRTNAHFVQVCSNSVQTKPLSPTPPISYTTTDNSDNISTKRDNITYKEKEINKEKESLADFEARYRKENMWADAAFVVKTTEANVKSVFETFLAEQKHNNTTYENYPDFTKHFLSYLRIHVNKANTNNNGITYQQLNARRRATEVQKGGDYSQEF